MSNPNPGWYPHPDGSGRQAYWTGDSWDFSVDQYPPTQAMTEPFPPTGSFYSPPPRQNKNWLAAGLIAGGVIVLAVLLAVTLVSTTTTDSRDAQAPPTSVSTPTPTRTKTPTTTKSKGEALRDWGRDAAPELTNMQDAFGAVSDAGDAGDVNAMAAACTQLAGAIAKVRQKLPTPDPEVTTELAAALDAYGRGAATCSLVDTGTISPDELSQAADDLREGNSRLAAATALIKASR